MHKSQEKSVDASAVRQRAEQGVLPQSPLRGGPESPISDWRTANASGGITRWRSLS